jgi:hypothetical protein
VLGRLVSEIQTTENSWNFREFGRMANFFLQLWV